MVNDRTFALCCNHCKAKFGYLYNLKKHVRKFHSEDTDYLKTLSNRKKVFKFFCDLCNRRFNKKSNYTFHRKSHVGHDQESKTSEPSKLNTNAECAICHTKCLNKKSVLLHYVEAHNIVMKENSLNLANIDEFYEWKKQFEIDTNSRFIRESFNTVKTHKYFRFTCHRSGYYVPEGKVKYSLYCFLLYVK